MMMIFFHSMNFFSFTFVSFWLGGIKGPYSLLFNGYRSSIPGLIWPGRAVGHSPPISAKFKTEWSYISIQLQAATT